MKFCNKCGKENNQDSKFCNSCGNKFDNDFIETNSKNNKGKKSKGFFKNKSCNLTK